MNKTEKKWSVSWQQPVFRKKMIIGWLLVIAVLAILPLFFPLIEQRTGPVLNDWFLHRITAIDVSVPIFLFVWGATILGIARAIQDPSVCILLFWTYFLVTFSRLISIWLVPLDPPEHLIPLIDPLSNTFYGNHFITKDLFYSGHTSSMFVILFCLPRKWDKVFVLICAIAVGVLLLVQHVHYTIDVLFAPVFTFLFYHWGRKITANARALISTKYEVRST